MMQSMKSVEVWVEDGRQQPFCFLEETVCILSQLNSSQVLFKTLTTVFP